MSPDSSSQGGPPHDEGRLSFVEGVLPFAFLPPERRAAVAAELVELHFEAGDVVIEAGTTPTSVVLIAEGSLVVRAGEVVESTITVGQTAGEQEALFARPAQHTVTAQEPTRAYALDNEHFLALAREEPRAGLALANQLRDKHGVFASYRHLFATIRAALDRRAFLLEELVDAYCSVRPALHPKLGEAALDLGALAYATARLPAGVTSTTYFYLCSSLPVLYQDADALFERVPTAARRRAVWQVLPGKLLVLLRDGITDVVDLLTCLCAYVVEARKIRRRLRSAEVLERLRATPEEAAAELLGTLPLSLEEQQGLMQLWPGHTLATLRTVLLHHEDIGIECDLVAQDHNASASEAWVRQIRAAARRLVDLDDPGLEVHVISSNTHSVANCLSPYLGEERERIEAWGEAHAPDEVRGLTDPRDRLYVWARAFEEAHPQERLQRIERERRAGHERLVSTAYTGIAVDLFDMRRFEPELCDPAAEVRVASGPALLVNVDYAFGQQAEEILANLCFVFGRRLRSVNVLGKAGGLLGRRGDLLLPTALLLQPSDDLVPLDQALGRQALESLAGGRTVHQGRVLTVAGTLLQDPALLRFYHHLYGCVGLEMEGSYFARQLRAAVEMGVVGDVTTRYAYYVSDLPLDHGENLSEGLAAHEGVPPLYAITRAVLKGVFEAFS